MKVSAATGWSCFQATHYLLRTQLRKIDGNDGKERAQAHLEKKKKKNATGNIQLLYQLIMHHLYFAPSLQTAAGCNVAEHARVGTEEHILRADERKETSACTYRTQY